MNPIQWLLLLTVVLFLIGILGQFGVANDYWSGEDK
jgi:NADH:ubiquinone oxidoreductase subunit K